MNSRTKRSPASKAENGVVPQRDAEATRARILEAARVRFSRVAYDGVGLREIASDAGIDTALIPRYFGSKEGLFREIAETAFGTHELASEGSAGLPKRARDMLMGKMDDEAWRQGFDPLRLLLASLGSTVAGPIAAECLERDFMRPLANAIGSPSARERSALVTAQIVGIAVIRLILAAHDDHIDMTRLAELTELVMTAAVTGDKK